MIKYTSSDCGGHLPDDPDCIVGLAGVELPEQCFLYGFEINGSTVSVGIGGENCTDSAVSVAYLCPGSNCFISSFAGGDFGRFFTFSRWGFSFRITCFGFWETLRKYTKLKILKDVHVENHCTNDSNDFLQTQMLDL